MTDRAALGDLHMTRTRIATLVILFVAVPAATAAVFGPAAKPCFQAGDAAYRLTDSAASLTVRIDNHAAHPDLRLQLVDDPATADFVLVDGDGSNACGGAVQTISFDTGAAKPDLVVALTRAPAEHKIFVRSVRYSDDDAAALYAAMWRNTHKAVAARD